MKNEALWVVIGNSLSASLVGIPDVDIENATDALVGVLGWHEVGPRLVLPQGEVLVDFGGNEYRVCIVETNDIDGVCWADVDYHSRFPIESHHQWKDI